MKNERRMKKRGLLDRIVSQRMEKLELKKSHRLIILISEYLVPQRNHHRSSHKFCVIL